MTVLLGDSQTLKRGTSVSLILEYYRVNTFVRFLSNFVTNDEKNLMFDGKEFSVLYTVSSEVLISIFFRQAFSR